MRTDSTTLHVLFWAVFLCWPSLAMAENPQLQLVSSPSARYVTGESTLLWSATPALRLHVDGVAFQADATAGDGGHYYLVHGLQAGTHRLVAEAADGARTTLTLQVSSDQGPLVSGPWQSPFLCQTERFEVGPGLGQLPKSSPPACTVPARVDHLVLTTDGAFAAASRRIREGALQVRLFTRVVGRAITQLAVPVRDARQVFAPGTRAAPWNGKLVFTLGGGCRGGWYRQGDTIGPVLDANLLRAGYAVVSTSLNVFGNNCNDLLAAEVAMLAKEFVVETLGPPWFTIGFGCSGGSYQGLQIADNYPGIFDGVLVGCVFPEVGQAMSATLFDARLLQRYFDGSAVAANFAPTPEQVRAITGFASEAHLRVAAAGAGRLDPMPRLDRIAAEFHPDIPEEWRWQPALRPRGARPTVFDHTVNVYGVDPATGHARWPLDNRGVLYGLVAWQRGVIADAQFVHLNTHIGGLDRNGEFGPARTAHDPEATAAAYATGRILDGGQGLAVTPIIDYRAWADGLPQGDTHLAFHSASLRARLMRANGDRDNLVVLQEDGSCASCPLFSLAQPLLRDALTGVDSWLTRLVAGRPSWQLDRHDRAAARAALRAAKPAELVDTCVVDGQRFAVDPLADDTACSARYPHFRAPRLVAGAPMSNDVVACTRRPLAEAVPRRVDGTPLAGPALDALARAMADGVCDYDAPALGRVPHLGPYPSVGPIAGGLGAEAETP